ncbi:hypothetical protein Lalb_Chr16g0387901 [Lupinus albus]|uniref:Uncharacterized protein n=1 Tax=Lupinus albus TaxID=3870 RepID=A0A6A4PDF9_LUPAL|nr:hypothetical protein Lalb_Chr16g0387901 [Lupinus albus]
MTTNIPIPFRFYIHFYSVPVDLLLLVEPRSPPSPFIIEPHFFINFNLSLHSME